MTPTTAEIPNIVRFSDADAVVHSAVGGKAASLGRLSRAGFPIPPGFTVSTTGYSAFLKANDLQNAIADVVPLIDYSDVDGLERLTGSLRARIEQARIPDDLARMILDGYHALGGSAYVAVRSSGTAEDLADASFAGLHDTYLDVHGDAEVLDAVKRCWASLWTARCTAYRHHGGHDHSSALLAVVIQTMVESEAAGVLFTGNPLTARTDEVVVNAAWGLGEGVVSGILTPDEFVLDRKTLTVKSKVLGSKEVRIGRDRGATTGTLKEEVPASQRDVFSVTDENVVALGALGLRVTDFYGGLPQDIEWALAEGKLYLLQSRNITGVEFTWDEDVDGWQKLPEADGTVWSHAFADEFWTGAITPLFYSIRGREVHDINMHDFELWGFDDLRKMRSLKWYQGTAYYNSNQDRLYDEYLFPPSLRGSTLWKLPPAWRDAAAKAPFDVVKGIATQLRTLLLEPSRTFMNWFTEVEQYIRDRVPEADGPNDDELRQMPDAALRQSTQRTLDLAEHFIGLLRPAFHYYGVAILGLLNKMVQSWYSGPNKFLFQDLISGMPRRTKTAEETHAVWHVVKALRANPALIRLFEEHRGVGFFDRLQDSDEGRAFLQLYKAELLIPHGHRGHADRDLWYPRRIEDFSLDYESFRAFLVAGDGPTPADLEERLVRQREISTEEMLAGMGRDLFGSIKTESFKLLHAYVLKFLMVRDDERHYIDRVTFAKKKHFREIGRRLVDRGLLQRSDDFYFLAEHELYGVWDGRASGPLVEAKLANRRKLFERHLARAVVVAPYVQDGKPVELETEGGPEAVEGVMRGTGVSRGSVTGTARVVPDLKQIGRVQKGEILVCNSTDPGWASIFSIISGLVMETGGLLAHGSCLSREYNLPAVTLRHAMGLIEDGATITVNGDTGEVRLVEPAAQANPVPAGD